MMKPPNITPPPTDQTQTPSQQQPPPTSPPVATTNEVVTVAPAVTSPIPTQPIITKPQPTIATTQVQQAPLALTTQPQTQTRPQTALPVAQAQSLATSIAPQSTTTITTITTTATTTQPQSIPTQIQSRIQPQLQQQQQPAQQLQTAATIAPSPAQSITITAAPTSTGPTALVIIPQHSTTTSITQAKTATFNSQLKQPPNRPPSTLPVVPIKTTASAAIKSEPNNFICCLLDNGVRCDRVAGNASFSARIQKIVGTKKMNFALDPTVRHAYICEHHKAIITVAKKSTTLARDTKSNARNYNNNASNLASQPNFNDLSVRQQTLQHPVNLELLTNQNRTTNNHSGTLNNMPVRQGTQIAYGHYQSTHQNQVASMDVMMSSSFDNAGGDSVPSGSSGVDVDLQQLQVNTLRRYKRHFRVQTRPGLNKMQLAESLKTHFRTLPIIEKEAITYFVYIVKCYRNKLDHNPKAD